MQRTREVFLKFDPLLALGRSEFSAPAFSAFLYNLGRFGSRLLDIAPLRLLQDDTVAIRVFVCSASRFPVWIEGRDLFETGGQHARACRLPLGCGRDVEYQQVFGRRRWHNRMGATVRELEVV